MLIGFIELSLKNLILRPYQFLFGDRKTLCFSIHPNKFWFGKKEFYKVKCFHQINFYLRIEKVK